MVKNGYDQYMKSSIMTAPPEELVLMLYNGAMKFLKRAMLHLEDNNLEGCHKAIIRAQDIVIEFMSKVDTNYEVGKNLLSLYEYMYRRLIEANIKKDMEIMQEVYDMFKELKETWEESIKIVRKNK